MNDQQENQSVTPVTNESQTVTEQTHIIEDTPVPNNTSAPIVEKSSAPESIDSVKPEVSNQQHRAIQEFSINAKEQLETADTVVLPSDIDSAVKARFEKLPQGRDVLDNHESRDWAETVAEGMSYTGSQDMFVPTLLDETAEFRQRVEHNQISLSGQVPAFREIENQNLKGERAIGRFISHLGLGALFTTPLWHSGIWVTFKPPTEAEIVELNRVLTSDKIKFGRYTYGLAYSNTTVYTIDRVIEFALAHIFDLTAMSDGNGIAPETLRNHISCQDIPSLLWGFVCTMYPRGFKYRRACVNDADACNYILEETLNLAKLQWTNTKALTDWQKTFMSGRQPKSKTLADINHYKEELTKLQKKRVVLFKESPREIALTLITPTIADYIDSGHRWIGDIVNTVDKALQADSLDNERNALIIRHGQASALRQYAHWIQSLEYNTNIVDDKETIEGLLDVLSADDEVRNSIIKEIIDYINGSTISIIGIPVFDCPKCNTTQESSMVGEQYKNVIPLDMVQLFFGLVGQRLMRLIDR